MRTNADDASNYLVIMTEYAYKMRMVVACNEVTERERERPEYVQLMIHDPNSVHPAAGYSQNHAVSLTPLDLLGFVFAISSSMMLSQQPRFGE
jgi:hypothetical protein